MNVKVPSTHKRTRKRNRLMIPTTPSAPLRRLPAGNRADVVLIGTLTPKARTVHRIMDAAGTTCKESVMTHNRRAAFFAELAAPSLCRKCGWPAA